MTEPATPPHTAVVEIDSKLEAEWDDLAVRTGAAPFSRPAWVRAWRYALEYPVTAATARQAGSLVAVIPVIERRKGIATAADWHVPMLEAVAVDRQALDALAVHLLTGRRSVTVDFVPAGGPTADAFEAAFELLGFRVRSRPRLQSPFVDFSDGWDPYVETLSTRKWREIRRRLRRLEEEGPVDFVVSDGAHDLDRQLSDGFAIEGSGWKDSRGTAITSDRRVERFYREVTCWAANQGMARIAFLQVAGRPVAFDLSFVHGGTEWLLKTGFDPAWSRFSPGSLLRAEALRRACEEKVVSYEFAGSADAWKMEWTTTTREIRILEGFAPGLGGATAMQAARVGRRLRTVLARSGGSRGRR
jgi:CelD/BcsL family acetyltransferase involved in cellulose biosynthesis